MFKKMFKKGKNNKAVDKVLQNPEPVVSTEAAASPAPTQDAAPVSKIDQFSVPEARQEAIRKSDAAGAMIQRELGALELQYLAAKGKLAMAFETNRKEYEGLLKEASKEAGVDMDKVGKDERWEFNFPQMTFHRVDKKG